MGVAADVGVDVEVRTPVAAYRIGTPNSELTDLPLICVTVYQLDPDFQFGQLVPHDEPLTVPDTVTALARPSEVLTVALVDALVRRFAPEQAGATDCDEAEIGATPTSTSITAAMNAVSQRPRWARLRWARLLGEGEAAVLISIGSPSVAAPTWRDHDPTGPIGTLPMVLVAGAQEPATCQPSIQLARAGVWLFNTLGARGMLSLENAVPRTPLAAKLSDAASAARESWERDVPLDRVVSEQISRRDLLRRTGLLGVAGAAILAGARVQPVRAAAGPTPRIAVIGAGLAGLTCAYRLKQAGYNATVYEASDRAGGRCWTIREAFADGQIAEHGGELIDQNHTAIRQLAQELGFPLDNLLAAQMTGTEDFFFFDGAPYSFKDATSDLKDIWQQIHSDVSAASYPTLYNNFTTRGRELDYLSITDYINAYVPASARGYDVGPGMQSKLGQLLDIAYNIEYGGESSVQSSLNLLYLLAYSGQGQLRIFGPSNEKYHVVGGNDQIPRALASLLGSQVAFGMELTAVARNNDGSYNLSFRGQTKATVVDRVVLALPFSMLKSVNTAKANFSALKNTAIQNLPMGTNSKLHVQFKDRHWNLLGNNGNSIADTGYQNTWEVTRAQAGTSGILVNYTGGNIGASFGSGTPDARAKAFLAQIEPVLPGITKKYVPGRATIDFWAAYPWTKGSYSYWKVGQYTTFSGVEKERQGNVHFAGEHTSQDFQGYLNGAVETGARATAEILADYKAGILP